MPHVEVPLRWSDMDVQGHVNNARIADYLQEARVQLFAESGLLEHGVVVVRQQMQFRRPIEYSETPVQVEMGVTRLGGAQVEIGYVLTQFDQVVAEARTLLAAFDFDEQRPARLSASMRRHLEPHLVEWEPFSPLTAPPLEGRGTRTLHPTRWTDLDRYAHVNNVMAFEYLQQARIEVSPKWDPTLARTGTGESLHLWLVVRQDIDYIAQIEHSLQPLVVHTAPVALGRTSITSAAEIMAPDGALLARGRTVVVCADLKGRPTELPNRSRLEGFLVKP